VNARQKRFLRVIQHRAARVAIGGSAARGRGNSGVVKNARQFLLDVKLMRFATRDPRVFARALDATTRGLMAALPRRGATWGLARKLLNIFLRDSLYTTYLSKAYDLVSAERLLEIPLDSITATRLRHEAPDLPRWLGVRHLDPHVSAAYQAAALLVAKRERTARVHLDAYWWGARE
jgi:hypothetical protein